MKTVEELLGSDWQQRLHRIVKEVMAQKPEVPKPPSEIDIDNWRRSKIDGLRFSRAEHLIKAGRLTTELIKSGINEERWSPYVY